MKGKSRTGDATAKRPHQLSGIEFHEPHFRAGADRRVPAIGGECKFLHLRLVPQFHGLRSRQPPNGKTFVRSRSDVAPLARYPNPWPRFAVLDLDEALSIAESSNDDLAARFGN